MDYQRNGIELMSAIQQALFMGGPAAAANDPYFSSVKLLCHFDGANGQTTTVDSSGAAHAITSYASTSLSTAQAKFGTSSSPSSGTSRWYTADSADWAFGSGQFTIDAFVYFSNAPGSNTCGVVTQWISNGNLGFFFGVVGGALNFYYSTNGSDNPNVGAAWTPALNTWYHIAVDRDASNVLRVYLNGAVWASATVSAALYDSSSILDIAGNSATTGISGYVDEVRITKGVARYAGAFTPPTAAFPNS